MRWPRRRAPKVTAEQMIRAAINGAVVNHLHTVKHEPIPKPEGASVVFKRPDGSDAWRGHIQVGPRYRTRMQIPLANINPKFSPADFLDLEFEWER